MQENENRSYSGGIAWAREKTSKKQMQRKNHSTPWKKKDKLRKKGLKASPPHWSPSEFIRGRSDDRFPSPAHFNLNHILRVSEEIGEEFVVNYWKIDGTLENPLNRSINCLNPEVQWSACALTALVNGIIGFRPSFSSTLSWTFLAPILFR